MQATQNIIDPVFRSPLRRRQPHRVKQPTVQYGPQWIRRSVNSGPKISDFVKPSRMPSVSQNVQYSALPVPLRRGQLPMSRRVPPSIMQQHPTQSNAARRKSTLREAPVLRLAKSQTTQIVFLVFSAIIIGPFLQSLVFGEVVIAAYAIYAIIKHVTSQTAFLLSLITLTSIVVLHTLGDTGTLADNFTVYTFLLMIIGTCLLGLEARQNA